MADQGTSSTDKKIKKVKKEIEQIYGQAQKEIEDKMSDWGQKFFVKNNIYRQKLTDGLITEDQYNAWFAGQMFQNEQWHAKLEQITGILTNANQQAAKIVNGGQIDVFTANYNWICYDLEHTAGVNFGFNLYDQHTVTELIKGKNKILPEWKIDEPKDYVWNAQKVRNCVVQGIIQGEGIQDIAKRVATVTCNQNKNLALTHARTAMTGAQNSGRSVGLQDAKKLGIKVVKEWMATLDGHTRDSHRSVDGEQIDPGDLWHPTKFSNGCRFPGDPLGPAHEVFNCRCTLVGDLKDFPEEYQRYDNIDGVPVENMTYKQWEKAKHPEVKKEPKVDGKIKKLQKEIEDLQAEADELQMSIEMSGADYVFDNIWYGKSVTYADWEGVRDSIPAKIDYFINAENNATRAVLEDFDHLRFAAADESIINSARTEVMPILQKLKYDEIISVGDMETLIKWKLIDGPDDILDAAGVVKSSHAAQWMERYRKFQMHINELEMFLQHGEEYSRMVLEHQDIMKKISLVQSEIHSLSSAGPFSADAYTQARKDAAMWAQTPREADKILRPVTGEIWRDATKAERRAGYEYTAGSGSFNRPLRGYDGSWYHSKGVGQVSLDNEGSEKDIKLLTGMIERSKLPQDTWLQRGVGTDGLAGFLGIPEHTLSTASQEELEQLLIGREVTDTAFFSCGSSKGSGFSGNILNVYCPQGTQAMYVEPFSAFGRGGIDWDGVSEASSLGGELETIVQRNTTFRIVKVEKGPYGRLYLDIEVVDQRPNDWSPWD